MSDVRPWFILATPRSGSTWVYEVMAEYLKRSLGTKSLNECFNQHGNYLFERNGVLWAKWSLSAQAVFGRQVFSEDEACRRISLLDGRASEYFFKLFPGHLHGEGLEWVRENYRCLLWDRRNHFQQFLSYSLSLGTDRWYHRDGLGIQDGSVEFQQWMLDVYRKKREGLQPLREFFRPEVTLYYEDFAPEFRPSEVLDLLGLDGSSNLDFQRVPARQNPLEKLKLFSNPDVVIKAWDAAAL